MSVPISQMATVAGYILRQKLAGRRRYPLVLMLEPLYRCNLACAGCGKIQYPGNVLKAQLSVDECLRATDECGAPVVSIPGGEPLLHPEIDRIVEGLVARRKYVYLCTNGLLLEENLQRFRPSKYLSFSVHLDGDAADHDAAVCREGTHETAVRAVRAALDRGFRVTTNTTLFEGADPERVADFFDATMRLGVEGMMVSPGYSYAAAPDKEHFLARAATRELFGRIFRIGARRKSRWQFNQSPLFLEFLAGGRDYDCTPWGMPSYGVFGWQKPCYLLQDGYAASYDKLLAETRWEKYGPRSGNPACRDCMVHSGFEASSVEEGFSSWRGFVAMARAALFGPRPAPATSADAPARTPALAPVQAPAPAVAPAPAPALTPVPAEAPALAPALAPGVDLVASPEILAAAFRFRGDVTLVLDDGSSVEGFVSAARPSEVSIWPRREPRPRRLAGERIRRVRFSGRDLAERGRQRIERPIAGTDA